ncbi:MAG: SRPBCC family protein, partial [Mycobacterium sp.]
MDVVRSVSVPLSPVRAFELFTMRMTDFWPKEHSIGNAEIAEVVLEPRSGGRWFERGIDGSECQWGRIAAWEPPRKVVLLWQIGVNWRFDPAFETEVEVT